MTIDYSQRIPNNVDLSNDRALQRALEGWQPAFLKSNSAEHRASDSAEKLLVKIQFGR